VVFQLGPTGAEAAFSSFTTGGVEPGEVEVAHRPDGSVFVAGATRTVGFAPSPNALQSMIAGGSDVFYMLLDAAGSQLEYASFLGGSGSEHVTGMKVASTGDLYITGKTGSANYPVSGSALQPVNAGDGDGFIARIGQWADDCVVSFVPPSVTVGPAADLAALEVETGGGCPWSASTNVGWISILPGSNSSGGGGTVSFAVESNPGAARTGYIFAGGATATITQAGNQSSCTFSVSPPIKVVGSGGGVFSVAVTASRPDCLWSATSTAGWLTVTDGIPGTGSGAFTYTVDVNTGGERTGSINLETW
jgi:hypothetical protein